MKLFLGILLLVMSIFLVIAVLMQNGKSKRLSGSIAGGAETFFGKSKSRTIDAVLSKVTTVVAIIFILVVIVVYVAFGNEMLTLQDMIDQGLIQIQDPETVTDNTVATGNDLVAEGDTAETPEAETPEAETPEAEAPVDEAPEAETPEVAPEAETPVAE